MFRVFYEFFSSSSVDDIEKKTPMWILGNVPVVARTLYTHTYHWQPNESGKEITTKEKERNEKNQRIGQDLKSDTPDDILISSM